MTDQVKFYEVGGCVRDSLLGLRSNDIDYTVTAPSYEAMKQAILNEYSGHIFQEREEFLTIRARVTIKTGEEGITHGEHNYIVPLLQDTCADFVLARKDGQYFDGRRPDTVIPGTLKDDLDRRDFTINAIARDPVTKELIDYHQGILHLNSRELYCVGNTMDRFKEDGLRIIRALRFLSRFNFTPSPSIDEVLSSANVFVPLLAGVHRERIRTELEKMLNHSTSDTFWWLDNYFSLGCYILNRVKLKTAGIVEGEVSDEGYGGGEED